MIDKTKILFIISIIIVASALAIYPNLSIYKQDDIITKIDSLNANRTKQIIELTELQLENQRIGLVNQNLTIQNQQLIKANQELIKYTTEQNLNLTRHNKLMLDDTNGDVDLILKHLNITHPRY